MIYDELDPENCIILRDFDHNYIHQSLSMINYVHHSSTVVAAGALGNDAIKFFDFETGKCLSEFRPLEEDDDDLSFGDSTVDTAGSSSVATASNEFVKAAEKVRMTRSEATS